MRQYTKKMSCLRGWGDRVWFSLFAGALGLVLLGLVMPGCGSSSSSSSGTSNSNTVSTHSLVGTWEGTWTDTVFDVSGAISVTISQSESSLSGTGTINLESLGLGDESGTASGTIDGEIVTFTFSAATVGSGGGTISGSSVSGSGTVTGALNYGPFTFSATVSGDTITGTFDFTDPSGGAGTATLTRQS